MCNISFEGVPDFKMLKNVRVGTKCAERTNFSSDILYFNLPCVTTAVERALRITTEAASVSTNRDSRDGHSFPKVSARNRNKIDVKHMKKKKCGNCNSSLSHNYLVTEAKICLMKYSKSIHNKLSM